MTHEFPHRSSELDTLDNFVRYTHPYCADLYEHQFPSSFDLSFIRLHIDDLYNFTPHDDLSRKNMAHGGNDHSLTNVERGSYLYLDQTDGSIKSTEIVSGTYDSLDLEFSEYFKKGGLPLMDIHTHPEDALFSSFDYTSLCRGDYDYKLRTTKASLVLCPNLQVLAFATATTPHLNQSQSDEFARAWEDTFYQRLAALDDEERNLRGYLLKTGWSKNSLHSIRNEEYRAKRAHIANQTLIELSRSIDIKMYVSDNRQDFFVAN